MRLGWFYLRLPDFEALGLDSAGAELGRRRQDPAQVITAALLRLSGVTGVTGVTDVIPSYDSVFVEFDAGVTTEARLRAWLSVALSSEPPDATVVSSATERTVTIPTVYGGRHGPDLAAASEITGLSEDRIVDLHTAAEYRVAAMGFLPGFAFMSGVPDPLRLARRSAPRPNVPAHSVAVANHQAGVYPLPSPGGWNLLGRSLVALYDPGRDEPFLVRPGDTVRFERAPRDAAPPADPAGLELLPLEPRLPVLRVLEPGLLDLVVDRGRWRMGRFGMARGGALDAPAAWFANRLLGNPDDAPLLESSLTGPVLEALRAVVVAVTGDALVPLVDGQRREPWSSFALRSGQTLSFSPGTGGSRSYLAVAGGLDTGTFEGSATTDLRGLIGRPLRAGDVMGAAARRTAVPGRTFRPHSRSSEHVRVRIVAGPQATSDALEALTAGSFVAAHGDRTGVALDGPAVPGGEVQSEGVPIGSIQVTSGGSPIVLLHDRGTLGGYSKPAVVHPDDLRLVAQARPNQRLRFVLTGDARTAASSSTRPTRRRAR